MNHTIPERKDTDPRFHWHIEDYFKTDADWEAAYVSLEESLPELTAFAGKLRRNTAFLPEKEWVAFPEIRPYLYLRLHADARG